jgi:hypothetical protein
MEVGPPAGEVDARKKKAQANKYNAMTTEQRLSNAETFANYVWEAARRKTKRLNDIRGPNHALFEHPFIQAGGRMIDD